MNTWFRQAHRILAIAFTATVIITTIALSLPEPIIWVSYVPLLPLFLLMISGLYLFALPYRLRRQTARQR